MSDAFLAKLTEAAPKASTSSSTYAEKRRRATATSEARAKANQLKPFRQREEEARQEGLRTNLIEKELEAGKEGGEMGVGMRMMLKLGYAPDENSTSVKSHETVGGSLGEVAPSSEDLEDAGDAEGARGGLGSSKRRKLDVPPLSTPVPEVSTSKPASGLLEPLSISIWAGKLRLLFLAHVFDSELTFFLISSLLSHRSKGCRREDQNLYQGRSSSTHHHPAARHLDVPVQRKCRVRRA